MPETVQELRQALKALRGDPEPEPEPSPMRGAHYDCIQVDDPSPFEGIDYGVADPTLTGTTSTKLNFLASGGGGHIEPAPENGDMRFNTRAHRIEYYEGGVWFPLPQAPP